jgi:hypothetical protein
MTLLRSLLRSAVLRQWRPEPFDGSRTSVGRCSRVGFALLMIWLVLTRRFWPHVFLALFTMTFATLLLPDEMTFFARHAVLLIAIPLASGFVGTNLGRSGLGSLAAWVVLGVLAVAIYRMVDADPATNPWLRPRADVSTSKSP